jgi:hypothetical protein
MIKPRVGEWFAVLFAVAIIYVLVRPSSNAAQFVAAIGRLGRVLVETATSVTRQ